MSLATILNPKAPNAATSYLKLRFGGPDYPLRPKGDLADQGLTYFLATSGTYPSKG